MKDTHEDSDYDIENSTQETHCTNCGTYLGAYGPGYGIIPCPKCKEPNLFDYTGQDLIVRRRRGARA